MRKKDSIQVRINRFLTQDLHTQKKITLTLSSSSKSEEELKKD